jgi:D-glycero-alpha-D-manno-heptose 1-phosphate guanylyltransferase
VEEAVVLAGGRGTRLAPVVGDRPKPLAPVAGRPFLDWVLRGLRQRGVRRVVLSTGHRGEQIEEHVRDDGFGLEVDCAREETPLGTGGGLRRVLARTRGDPLLVLNGDSWCAFDPARLLQLHRARGARATLWLVPVEDASRFGSVTVAVDGAVTAFQEKAGRAGRGLVSGGVYLLSRDAVAALPADTPLSLERDVFPGWVGDGLFAVRGEAPLLDIGTPESLARVQRGVDWEALTAGGEARA